MWVYKQTLTKLWWVYKSTFTLTELCWVNKNTFTNLIWTCDRIILYHVFETIMFYFDVVCQDRLKIIRDYHNVVFDNSI